MTGPLELATGSADATRELAAAMAGRCLPGDVLLLSGDLGAGKTTFAQGFGRALGIGEPVTSPTFTLVRQYELVDSPRGIRVVLHADVYRLEHLAEVADLGLGQLVEDAGVALVEWGEAAEPVLGDGALTVRLEADPDDDGRRTVTVASSGAAWDARWAELVAALGPWTTGGRVAATGGGAG
jgi:tRNA threonylcarbamoyladenosine biosynthesis protein TsaE